MDRHVVVGTAGHIDHGKTTLVKALTGVDTDRLAEEKARGITIDLGFAPLDLDGVPASVVDVPGHEAFVRNMVAGATGVDVGLLVVAADEGVMPQTLEHLAILGYLGVRRGVAALTKCDLAPDPAWRELVADDVRRALAAHLGAEWPVVEVSAADGSGLPALRAALRAQAEGVPVRSDADRFRMPVDRVFALPGAGTIVTGTAWSGSVAEGGRVLVFPAGVEARIRSVQVHGRAAPRAEPGRRAALALVGLAREAGARGAVVVTGTGWRASRAADAVVRLEPGRELRVRQRLRVHHGTSEVMARVARVAAGGTEGLPLRLAFDEPLVLRAGDRVVLRASSPVTTIGGGVITDPWADTLDHRRRRLDGQPAPMAPDDAGRLRRLVARRGRSGMDRAELEVASGLDRERFDTAFARALGTGLRGSGPWLVSEDEVDAAAARLDASLDAFHGAHPLAPGMPVQEWRAAAQGGPALQDLAEARVVERGGAVREAGVVRRPGFAPGSSAAARTAQDRVLALLRQAGAEPPTVGELASSLADIDVPAVVRLLERAGQAVAVNERYYAAEALELERTRLVAALRELGAASPAELRERLGRSRKWLIPFLEWADRADVTVRDGDRRRLKVQAGA